MLHCADKLNAVMITPTQPRQSLNCCTLLAFDKTSKYISCLTQFYQDRFPCYIRSTGVSNNINYGFHLSVPINHAGKPVYTISRLYFNGMQLLLISCTYAFPAMTQHCCCQFESVSPPPFFFSHFAICIDFFFSLSKNIPPRILQT